MGRPRKAIPSLYFHKHSGYWCVTVRGRRKYLSADKAVAEAKWRAQAAELLKAPDPGPARAAPAGVVDEVIAAYWKWAQTRYVKRGKPTGQVDRIKGAVGVLRRLHGTTPLRDFDEFALEAVQQEMVRLGWARGEINLRVSCLKRMFKWAAKRRLVTPGLAGALLLVEGLRRGTGQGREPRAVGPVADLAVERTLEHCGPVVAAMIRLQRLTGMRPCEVCHLRPCDVDRSGEAWVYTVPPEWNKVAHHDIAREVLIGPRGQAVLVPFLEREPTAYCFGPTEAAAWHAAGRRARRRTPACAEAPKRIKNPRRRPGACYSSNTYCGAVRRAIRRANAAWHPPLVWAPIPHWHPNQLRHALATEARRELGLDAAQAQLGHATAAMTERYAKVGRAEAAELVKRIG
jgi:integrase